MTYYLNVDNIILQHTHASAKLEQVEGEVKNYILSGTSLVAN